MKKYVSSPADIRANLKAIATLVGGIASALSALFAADSTEGKVLTILVVIASAIVTWAVPNAEVIKPGANPSGQEYPDGFDPNDRDEDETYQDYDDEVAAAQAYQPQHKAETVVWPDEADTPIPGHDQPEGDVEDEYTPDEADTPLPAFDADNPDQRLS